MEAPCPVPNCCRPSWDGLVCTPCAEQLRHDLQRLPADLRELDIKLTKLGVTGDSDARPSQSAPLPYDAAASEVAWCVRNTLSTWVRELDLGDTIGLANSPRAWCRWLHDRVERIRGHAAGGEIVDELRYLCSQVRRAIDLPPDLALVGSCDQCGNHLYALIDDTAVTCRHCSRAGIDVTYDVASTRMALASRVEGEQVTREVALAVIARAWGIPVRQATFRQWVHRERIQAVSASRDGRPLYRVGDVLDLARKLVASTSDTPTVRGA